MNIKIKSLVEETKMGLWARIKRFFKGGEDTTSLAISDYNPEITVISEGVHPHALKQQVDRHQNNLTGLVHRAWSSELSEETPAKISAALMATVNDLARVYNNWYNRAVQYLDGRSQEIEQEMDIWETPKAIEDRFRSEVEGHTNLMTATLQQIYEQKTRNELRANQLRQELSKIRKDRDHMLIRLVGDENGDIKPINMPVYIIVAILFLGTLTAIEAMLGMPIFRFESSGPFAYMLSMAFAWTLGGFTFVAADHLKKDLLCRQAHINYKHAYGPDHLPKDNSGRVVKPRAANLRDRLLAYGGSTVLVIIAVVLLSWRVLTSFGMESDGGMGFISAFLLLAVTTLIYFWKLFTGPQFTQAEYKKFFSYKEREDQIRSELKTLTDDTIVTGQIQNTLLHYKAEIEESERLIHEEASWLKQECKSLREQIDTLLEQADQLSNFLKRDVELVSTVINTDHSVKWDEIYEVANQPVWFNELIGKIENQVEIPQEALKRYEDFQPTYTLPKDGIVGDFKPLFEQYEQDAREKVLRLYAEEKKVAMDRLPDITAF